MWLDQGSTSDPLKFLTFFNDWSGFFFLVFFFFWPGAVALSEASSAPSLNPTFFREDLVRNCVARLTDHARNDIKCVEEP